MGYLAMAGNAAPISPEEMHRFLPPEPKPKTKVDWSLPKKLNVLDSYVHYDNGYNIHGFIVIQWPSDVKRKYHFQYNRPESVINITVRTMCPISKAWNLKKFPNPLVCKEILKLFRSEQAISRLEAERVFAKFS